MHQLGMLDQWIVKWRHIRTLLLKSPILVGGKEDLLQVYLGAGSVMGADTSLAPMMEDK